MPTLVDVCCCSGFRHNVVSSNTALFSDPEVVSSFRTFIPITTQRRFDLYPDIAEEFMETANGKVARRK